MFDFCFVIRWDRHETYGVSYSDIFENQFGYVTHIKIAPYARGCLFADSLNDNLLEFGSWAEAAAVAAFIIHHIDEKYEDALEVVKLSYESSNLQPNGC